MLNFFRNTHKSFIKCKPNIFSINKQIKIEEKVRGNQSAKQKTGHRKLVKRTKEKIIRKPVKKPNGRFPEYHLKISQKQNRSKRRKPGKETNGLNKRKIIEKKNRKPGDVLLPNRRSRNQLEKCSFDIPSAVFLVGWPMFLPSGRRE